MTFSYNDKTMNKIRIIQKLKDWIIDRSQASEALGVVERTIFRYLAKLKKEWQQWFIHWLTWKPSNHQPYNSKYAWLYKYVTLKKFHGFWPTLLAEKLEELYWFVIDSETLRLRMEKRWLWKVNHRKEKILRKKRERKLIYWMLLQFDWSYHDWLENGITKCLLIAIDDATWKILHAKFSEWEWIEEVINFWKEYIGTNGKPWAIYVDRHSSYKVNHPKDQFDKATKTRFWRAMESLWIEVIFAQSPEGKGRVERSFGTHQDRLIKEMRLAEIKTYDEANKFLSSYYIPKHNKKFWVKAIEQWDFHKPMTDNEKINFEWFFASISERTLQRDGTIEYKNNIYQLKKWQILKNHKTITIKESYLGNIALFSWNDPLYFDKILFR